MEREESKQGQAKAPSGPSVQAKCTDNVTSQSTSTRATVNRGQAEPRHHAKHAWDPRHIMTLESPGSIRKTQ